MSDYKKFQDKEKVKNLFDLWNSKGVYQRSDYEKFQEWLDSCPVDIVSYNDRTDLFDVTFHVPSEHDPNAYDHGREMQDEPEQHESDHSVRSYIYGDGRMQ